MENIFDIATAIKERLVDENHRNLTNRAIARILCERRNKSVCYFLTNNLNETISFGRDFVGNVNLIYHQRQTTSDVGQAVYKNTKLGRALIGELGVNAQYAAPRGIITIKPMTRAVYTPYGENAQDVQINLAGDPNKYIYASLENLLVKSAEEAKLKEKQKCLKELKQKQERLKLEAEAKAHVGEEECVRLEKERVRCEQEKCVRNEEIAQIEQRIADAEENIKQQRAVLHKSVMLRSQHILDTYQEDAKRSHIYDGVPVVIEGGPGTGKTTTVIQRLKFLLSKPSLEEYGAPLTPAQLERFTDPARWNQQWLFFSPTDLLLQYLRNNMHAEELNANENNTRTIERFRKVMLREYGIIDPSSPKFSEWKDKSGEPLILDSKEVISRFESFCVERVNQIREQLLSFETADFVWSAEAEAIKKICKQNEASDIASLCALLESLYSHREDYVNPIEDVFRDELNDIAMKVKQAVFKDDVVAMKLKDLFVQWQKESKQITQADVSDEELEEGILEENENVSEMEKIDFDAELYSTVRRLVRSLGLKMVDSNAKVRGRSLELLNIVEPFINRCVDQDNLKSIGEYVLFSRNFASFCRGTESVFINKIPQMYKLFRKELVVLAESIYNIDLLSNIIKKDNNRCLHVDEQNLILGFINNTLIGFSTRHRNRFAELKGRFVKSYKENCRPIIGIDEATDYTMMDFYCMVSFRYNEFSSITLSGDLMQGMRKDGISNWETLKELFPKMEKFSLNISYRQSPTLVEMARKLYKDSLGEYPTYKSKDTKREDEAKPILLISNDLSKKVAWICNCILEIYKKYGFLPSIAIFVGDEINVDKFIEAIEDVNILNGIDVVNCSSGRTLDSKEVVRVFRLSEIKGMEFEAAFFYDIDTAIQNQSNDLMRRNLYVGVSRAASHLAATMTTKEGNETVIKYFETENANW